MIHCNFTFRYLCWSYLKTKIDAIIEGPFSWFGVFVGVTGISLLSLAVSHCLLIYGTHKEAHKFLKKWLMTNCIVFTVLLVLIFALLFTGYFKLALTKTEFIWTLVITGLIGGLRFFSVLVVFQYRKNLVDLEERTKRGTCDYFKKMPN